MKKIAILQSNYLPWKGVFDMINRVDEFVFYDEVKYTKSDWRNRNKIKTQQGTSWITVPIDNADKYSCIIKDARIKQNTSWQQKHYNSFEVNYSKAPFFKQYKWILERLYLEKKWQSLSELNVYCTVLISEVLGIKTKFIDSSEIDADGKRTEKLINMCKRLGATHYLSGPSAKSYLNEPEFAAAGIDLSYMNYKYREYPQLYGSFVHEVTILDAVFNCGEAAGEFIFER